MDTLRMLGEVSGLSVFGGIPRDFFTSCHCLEDCWDDFFSSMPEVKTPQDFERFCRKSVADVVVAREGGPSGRIVCVGYVVYETDFSLCFHGYCAPEYRTPKVSIPCVELAIHYFFQRYPKLLRVSTVGRWGNRVARLYAVRQGFNIIRLPKYYMHHGKLVDAYFGYILREEHRGPNREPNREREVEDERE
jgi:hypothetical protein